MTWVTDWTPEEIAFLKAERKKKSPRPYHVLAKHWQELTGAPKPRVRSVLQKKARELGLTVEKQTGGPNRPDGNPHLDRVKERVAILMAGGMDEAQAYREAARMHGTNLPRGGSSMGWF